MRAESRNNRRHAQLGFTLIEIMMVISIILILASIGVPAYNSWSGRSREAKAKSTIAMLELALERYRTDMGAYPQGTSDINASGLLNTWIFNSFTVSSVSYGPYMKVKSGDISGSSLIDPWGNTYKVYTYPGSTSADFAYNKSTCYILSDGPTAATGDEISNYQLEQR